MSVLGGDTNLLQERFRCHPRLEVRCTSIDQGQIRSTNGRVCNNMKGKQEVRTAQNGIDLMWVAALWVVPFLDNPHSK